MNDQKENAQKDPQRTKDLIDPMIPYDKSKLVNPMEAVNKETAHPPQSRDAFFAEMRAKYHMSDQETASQTPGISKERFESVMGIPTRDAVQQTSAKPQAAIASQSVTADAAPDITLAELPVGRKEGPTPLDLVKKMMNCCAMVVKDGELYLYGHGWYRKLEPKEAETEIWSYCRKEVEQTGSKSILTSAYQML